MTQLPIEPSFLVKPEEYNFGDETALLDTKAWTAVFDEAKLIYPGVISVEMREMSAKADWASLENHYKTVLLTEAGWEKETRFCKLTDLAHVTAFRNRNRFIAFVGLKSEYQEGGWIPVKFISNMPELL